MAAAPRTPPRYVPTLTEVVRPVAAPSDGASPSMEPMLEQMREQIIHRVLQRVDLSLDRHLREAVATLVLEHTRNLGPALREEIELVVRQCVTDAMAQELPGRAADARKP